MERRQPLDRRISVQSLLNDSSEVVARGPAGAGRCDVFSLPLHSRTFSSRSQHAFSPSSSPPTPHLVRSDSSDSTMQRSPSPVTPSFIDFNGLQPTNSKQDGAFPFIPQVDPSMATYPPPINPHAAHFTYPAPQAIAPQPSLGQGPVQGPPSISDQASTSSKGPAKQQTKKNSYPCPLAKQYNCQDHFTTSGHAARHAKKHTGKKDAFCPECNKAFTRKDNMEQHRRTHQNGRNATKAAGGESAPKRQRTSKRASTAGTSAPDQIVTSGMPLQTSLPAAPGMVDPSLAHSPASSFGFPDSAFAPSLNMMQQYADPSMQFANFVPQSPTMVLDPALGGQMPNGMANGLDTLAMAAAKRDDHF